jgi:hypothetical protein
MIWLGSECAAIAGFMDFKNLKAVLATYAPNWGIKLNTVAMNATTTNGAKL